MSRYITSDEARDELYAEWLPKHHNTAIYFGAAVGGLIVLFTIIHWTETLLHGSGGRGVRQIEKAFHTLLRQLNTIQPWPFSLSPTQCILVLAFTGINAALTFYDGPENDPLLTILAQRFGWMTLCNLCLTVFLGLKNTPLSPLAGRSFDNLNVLHRCCGYTTIIFMLLHAITFLDGLTAFNYLGPAMTVEPQLFGPVAGCSLIVILLTANAYVRHRKYELSYVLHVFFVAVVLIFVGLHRPDFAERSPIITLIAAGMWLADRSLRLARWIYHSNGNYCTLVPLADQSTMVTMHRPLTAKPGSSALLWIPGVRLFEAHPFSLVSNEPAEFVIKARGGFTRDLYDVACKNPGAQLRAAVEGPYGKVPDPKKYDNVVVIAGGSGATFAISMALDWARSESASNAAGKLDFFWTVRDKVTLTGFDAALSELQSHRQIDLRIYVTGSNSAHENESLRRESPSSSDTDMEKNEEARKNPAYTASNLATQNGRPDIAAVISRIMPACEAHEKVLVACCGPNPLIASVKTAVAKASKTGRPSIKLHCEEFSY